MMKSVLCLASLIVAISASYSRPPLGHRPSHGGALGGIDPFTLLLLKDGGLGHGGGLSGLLPLLLLGGGGLGGKGKGGLGINPLLLSLLGGCTEKYPKCIQPKIANADGKRICGLGNQEKCQKYHPNDAICLPCCTCPDTPSSPLEVAT